ncbi:hypothetical protein E2C01_083390 [Portunus trituberculatus]|uniref:Uncharacterized protein n=1 Tax=Portunus trituberculatus TaxID=210409 RepID=A0A5B7J133_PORTR|nr:hypothetical protein [Portunus trituberculatus]
MKELQGGCFGNKCKCCVGFHLDSLCGGQLACDDGLGHCRDECNEWEEEVHGKCGQFCKCCEAKIEVLLDLEKCRHDGGSFKASCSKLEKEVGRGCSSPHYCCCAPIDGNATLSPYVTWHKETMKRHYIKRKRF